MKGILQSTALEGEDSVNEIVRKGHTRMDLLPSGPVPIL